MTAMLGSQAKTVTRSWHKVTTLDRSLFPAREHSHKNMQRLLRAINFGGAELQGLHCHLLRLTRNKEHPTGMKASPLTLPKARRPAQTQKSIFHYFHRTVQRLRNSEEHVFSAAWMLRTFKAFRLSGCGFGLSLHAGPCRHGGLSKWLLCHHLSVGPSPASIGNSASNRFA